VTVPARHPCPLTVIVATTQPWPELDLCLASLHAQAMAAGAEVVVVDGDGRGWPAEAGRRYPGVTAMSMPGASVLQMRARAMAAARGAIVAVTEDHCRVAPDWCSRLMAAHDEHPEAAVIGGAVDNGSDTATIHWASFFIVNGPAMPPLRDGASRKVAGQATVSYKAHVVPRDAPERGRMEWMLNESLRRQGHVLWTDSRIRVSHDQPLTFAEACAIHFHDSKTIAGFRLFEMSPEERLLRIAVCAIMAPLLFVRTTVPLAAKRRHTGWLVKSLPMIGVLCVCRAAGALAGFLVGHGSSPRRIR
jgi:hypothetical protein